MRAAPGSRSHGPTATSLPPHVRRWPAKRTALLPTTARPTLRPCAVAMPASSPRYPAPDLGTINPLLVGFIVTNMTRPAERVVAFYNQRGTAEQWIKEGKNAVTWTRLSCHRFAANAVRLQLHALAYTRPSARRTASAE